ncbi:replicative DNA helicase [Aurantimonas coralicida]|uniref:replicative DNA helicase n=1 Tax=Aurantimonas coralicida TaxID=182270 RepID=UPI0035110148
MNAQADPIDFAGAVNIEAEQAILGVLLMDNALVASEVSFLEPEHFGENLHETTFRAIVDLTSRGRRADPVTLKDYLADEKVSEDMTVSQYLARLVAAAVPASLAREYALAVIDSHAARKAARACDDYAGRFLARDPSKGITDLVAGLEDELGAVRALAPSVKERESISDVIGSLMHSLSESRQAACKVIPVPLAEIAEVLDDDGFQAGNLYGLLGASGEGKTSLTLQMARTACETGHPTLILSYDQTFEQVARQMISQDSGISVPQMIRHNPPNNATINAHEAGLIADASEKLRAFPLQVRKLDRHKIGSALSIAKAWVKTVRKTRRPDGGAWGVPLVILDHVSAVTPEDPRADAGTKAAGVNRPFKALAQEIDAACLLLNQRNGEGSKRYVPRPIASDLYGGEGARQDYDAVLYVYRPERWRDEQLRIAKDGAEAGKIRDRFMMRESWDSEPIDPEGKAEIGSIKTRYAKVSSRFVEFEGRFTRYKSMRRAAPELF